MPISTMAAPLALPKEISQRKQSYDLCLYYASYAWDDGESLLEDVAKVAIYKCDQSLQKLAAIRARGMSDEQAAFKRIVRELRSDVPYGIVQVLIARMNKEEKRKTLHSDESSDKMSRVRTY